MFIYPIKNIPSPACNIDFFLRNKPDFYNDFLDSFSFVKYLPAVRINDLPVNFFSINVGFRNRSTCNDKKRENFKDCSCSLVVFWILTRTLPNVAICVYSLDEVSPGGIVSGGVIQDKFI